MISDWTLNWSWALKFAHHWGTGARVVRGTECGVYNDDLLKGMKAEMYEMKKKMQEKMV